MSYIQRFITLLPVLMLLFTACAPAPQNTGTVRNTIQNFNFSVDLAHSTISNVPVDQAGGAEVKGVYVASFDGDILAIDMDSRLMTAFIEGTQKSHEIPTPEENVLVLTYGDGGGKFQLMFWKKHVYVNGNPDHQGSVKQLDGTIEIIHVSCMDYPGPLISPLRLYDGTIAYITENDAIVLMPDGWNHNGTYTPATKEDVRIFPSKFGESYFRRENSYGYCDGVLMRAGGYDIEASTSMPPTLTPIP